jgi:hypothetical protein
VKSSQSDVLVALTAERAANLVPVQDRYIDISETLVKVATTAERASDLIPVQDTEVFHLMAEIAS